MNETCHIGMLLFPQVTQLDLTGPVQILSRVPGASVHLLWKDTAPVMTDAGFSINPTTAFDDSPQLDVLCVPGGFGIVDLLGDSETLDFLRRQAAAARYVTSVCNGSLVLGAAGLLQGYRSACHWNWRHYLPAFGAIPGDERIVRDRNRISGGGVTAGIDFALALAAELAGEETARMLQLGFEYDPQPPFDCGSPARAGAARVAAYQERLAPRMQAAERAVAAASFSLRAGS
ncbi:DJ-1/PfpI family protein [Massilia sp. IC2-477]|uniref:DJ-1/PfpI family protein n=1 Tax=Massilia sp. IC2-477 TaxID=2887198 RepID=UPI001D1289C7|nr:DJ-1/PfpI family protein [Massilia sp. IC2-477]MCC2955431.1 DJ-1/PfpI family protein [Massilia sp. IC2-477]